MKENVEPNEAEPSGAEIRQTAPWLRATAEDSIGLGFEAPLVEGNNGRLSRLERSLLCSNPTRQRNA